MTATLTAAPAVFCELTRPGLVYWPVADPQKQRRLPDTTTTYRLSEGVTPPERVRKGQSVYRLTASGLPALAPIAGVPDAVVYCYQLDESTEGPPPRPLDFIATPT